MPLLENVPVTSTVEPVIFKTLTVHGQHVVSISVSFGLNLFRGSRAIDPTGFPWLSLCDLKLSPKDLKNLISCVLTISEYLRKFRLRSFQQFRSYQAHNISMAVAA